MSSCTKTEIRQISPILQVVAAFSTRPGPVGNLVLFKSCHLRCLASPLVHICGCVRIWHGKQSALGPTSKWRTVFNRKGVEGKVVGFESQDKVDRSFPMFQGL